MLNINLRWITPNSAQKHPLPKNLVKEVELCNARYGTQK